MIKLLKQGLYLPLLAALCLCAPAFGQGTGPGGVPGAAPTLAPLTSAQVIALFANASGCGTPSNVLTPQSGTCVAPGTAPVSSVANSDGTLTVSPTTGAVVASLALGHVNTWTAGQTFSAALTSTVATGAAPFIVASTTQVANLNAATAGTATNLSGTGVNSAPYQSASGTTSYVTAPTTNGHLFVYAWQPTGSAVAPAAVDLATVPITATNFIGNLNGSNPERELLWSISSTLLATSTALGPAYFNKNGATLRAVTARLSGTISCTVAPTVVVLDLSTSVSTVYGSATVLTSLATGTADGAFSATGLSVTATAGHYIGFGLSAGTCVTFPQIDATATIQ